MWLTLEHVDGYDIDVNFNNVAYYKPDKDMTMIFFASPGDHRMYVTVAHDFSQVQAWLLEARER